MSSLVVESSGPLNAEVSSSEFVLSASVSMMMSLITLEGDGFAPGGDVSRELYERLSGYLRDGHLWYHC